MGREIYPNIDNHIIESLRDPFRFELMEINFIELRYWININEDNFFIKTSNGWYKVIGEFAKEEHKNA